MSSPASGLMTPTYAGVDRAALAAGAHGLLVVTPYYNKPPQHALMRHFRHSPMPQTCPSCSTTSLAEPAHCRHDTLLRLPNIPGSWPTRTPRVTRTAPQVMAESDLAYYSGDDGLNLALLSIGAGGFVSVIGHLVADRLREMH